jgi:hypothetical protein
MRPVAFTCRESLRLAPEQIAAQILDLSKWPEFEGYGILPGIERAEFEARTAEVVGTRIQVTNRDGSRHVEEIVEWDPARRLRLRMHEFSPPLSRLATSFDETWEFASDDVRTSVERSLTLHPRSRLARPILWMISRLLRRAIARHLHQLDRAAAAS